MQGSVARSAAAVLAEQTRLLDTVPPATRQVPCVFVCQGSELLQSQGRLSGLPVRAGRTDSLVPWLQALLARAVVAGGAVAVMVMFYLLYRAYAFAGSLRCFFDLLGFRFGDGCSVAQRLATGHRVSL